MAKQADATLQREFGLPLGLILIDTVAASAGYNQMGAENDSAVGQTIMNVLAQVAALANCCVLGVDHFGKNVDSGTRGASAKEASAAVVLAVLGTRELSGRVTNTRVALRKVRGAPQGEEYWFTVRKVEAPEPDEDGEPVSTLVIDWQQGPPAAGQAPPEMDPWQDSRQSDTAAIPGPSETNPDGGARPRRERQFRLPRMSRCGRPSTSSCSGPSSMRSCPRTALRRRNRTPGKGDFTEHDAGPRSLG